MAQCTIPVPIPSIAKAVPSPRRRFWVRMVAMEVSSPKSMAKYATRNTSVPITEVPNRMAT
ncbi:hypothetical protein D3C73_1570230 [compost metagenome]